jgi:hypothetical protein
VSALRSGVLEHEVEEVAQGGMELVELLVSVGNGVGGRVAGGVARRGGRSFRHGAIATDAKVVSSAAYVHIVRVRVQSVMCECSADSRDPLEKLTVMR